MKFKDMLIIYCFTKYHLPRFSGSLAIVLKPKAKYGFRAVAILLFPIPQKNVTKFAYISKTCFQRIFQNSILGVASVASNS